MKSASLSRKGQKPAKKRKQYHLVILILSLLSTDVNTQNDPIICPRDCYCTEGDPFKPTASDKSLRTYCANGGMTRIPVDEMDKQTQVITITAPPHNKNNIQLGPIFNTPKAFLQLEEISIQHSNIPSIGQNTFWGLRNLKLLDLSRNNISTLHYENFRGLKALKTLRLDENDLVFMPSEAFRYLVNLETLTLIKNNITNLVPRIFRMLANLIYLDLSYNPLVNLNPEIFRDIRGLQLFKCRSCKLKAVNLQIYNILEELVELDIGENLLEYLNSEEFASLRSLRILHLDNNQLSVIIDTMFSRNPNLVWLSVASNRIALLAPKAFMNLNQLQHLDLGFNQLTKFYLQSFEPVASLLYISFSGNKKLSLSEIRSVLEIMPDIQNVGMGFMDVEEIPNDFFIQNKQIKVLNISGNRLTAFPYKSLNYIPKLQTLDLSKNMLTTLHEIDLKRLEAVPVIWLNDNKFVCDCKAKCMVEYMKTSVLNETIQNLECHSPKNYQGRTFRTMDVKDLEYCPPSAETQTFIGTGFVSVGLILLISMIYCCCSKNKTISEDVNESDNKSVREDTSDSEISKSIRICTIHDPSGSNSIDSSRSVSPNSRQAARLALAHQAFHSPPPQVRHSIQLRTMQFNSAIYALPQKNISTLSCPEVSKNHDLI